MQNGRTSSKKQKEAFSSPQHSAKPTQKPEYNRGRLEIDPERRSAEGELHLTIPLKCTPIWYHLGCGGIPREGEGTKIAEIADIGSTPPRAAVPHEHRHYMPIEARSLKPTPFWDHLGCGGIPREGGGVKIG